MAHVSVIIPTYNRARYISRAIESVLAQTYRDFDVIVVDDGSSDDTRHVLEAFGDRIRYVFQENAGPGAARNCGIRLSTGAHLAFLDSDDVWMPTFLAQTVGTLDAHPEVGMVATGMYVGPAEARKVALVNDVEPGVWRLPTHATKGQIPLLFRCTSSDVIVARRDVVERYGGFYEHQCRFGEDVYLWLQVAMNHPIYRIAEPLAWYDTSASGLGIVSGKGHYPLEPVLVDTEAIWRNCPEEYREVLASWLVWHAVRSIHIQIATGNYESARWLIDHYSRVREWRLDWWKIRFKLAFPDVTSFLIAAKCTILRRRAM
jgi:glycosyltransferase involved in cell wall biosynthesis